MPRGHAIFFGWLVFGSLALVVACGTSNGDPDTRDLGDPPDDETTDTEQPPARPAFEAGFPDEPDAGNNDDGGTTSCNDPADPGSTPGNARVLPPTDDCDNTFKPLSGVISSPVDVDMYRVTGADKGPLPIPCVLDTSVPMTTAGVELCVFVHCSNDANAVTTVTGCNEGTKTTEPGTGWEGCCAVGTGAQFDPTPKWGCSGTDDSSDLLFRVSPTPETKSCQAYSFSYRF